MNPDEKTHRVLATLRIRDDGRQLCADVQSSQDTWAKVAEALAADPADAAIIEGYAALDTRVEGIAVYATSATTKRLQAAKRAATPATTP